jgi:DNA repair protein RadC
MRVFDREVLAVVLLNTRFRLIKFEKLSQGTVNETLAHPREILKRANIHSAYAFVLVHNTLVLVEMPPLATPTAA